jgi:hypothetical protein
MSRPRPPFRNRRTAFAVGALALAGIGTLAIAAPMAERPGDEILEAGEIPHLSEPLPAPVEGAVAFADTGAACLTEIQVSALLRNEKDAYGGEVVTVGGGQIFADTWRRQAGAAPVAVIMVVAHLMPNGGDGVADVIEIGAAGCALSRTLMTGGEWDYLIELAGQSGAVS